MWRQRVRRARVPWPFSVHHEARVASRLPSVVAPESRRGRAAAAAATGPLPARDRRRGRSVFRYRGPVFLQSAASRAGPVDRPESTTTTPFGCDPFTPSRTAAAFARSKRRRM